MGWPIAGPFTLNMPGDRSARAEDEDRKGPAALPGIAAVGKSQGVRLCLIIFLMIARFGSTQSCRLLGPAIRPGMVSPGVSPERPGRMTADPSEPYYAD